MHVPMKERDAGEAERQHVMEEEQRASDAKRQREFTTTTCPMHLVGQTYLVENLVPLHAGLKFNSRGFR